MESPPRIGSFWADPLQKFVAHLCQQRAARRHRGRLLADGVQLRAARLLKLLHPTWHLGRKAGDLQDAHGPIDRWRGVSRRAACARLCRARVWYASTSDVRRLAAAKSEKSRRNAIAFASAAQRARRVAGLAPDVAPLSPVTSAPPGALRAGTNSACAHEMTRSSTPAGKRAEGVGWRAPGGGDFRRRHLRVHVHT
eukprot:366225-Chlamydomonas_euryale.AAC.14